MRKALSRKQKDYIFILLVTIIPLIQFAIFYVYVNLNSFIMAFQTYDSETGKYVFYGWENFRLAFSKVSSEPLVWMQIKNSIFSYLGTVFLGIPLALMFSFYIYKKCPCGGIFKVLLFLPSILSPIVFVTLFKYSVNSALPEIIQQIFYVQIKGLTDPTATNTAFPTVLFYSIWFGMGANMLIYLGSMSSISESVVESAQIDGANSFQEFIHITIPMIFPTISTFMIASIVMFFVSDMGLYAFYGYDAEGYVQTIGYGLLQRMQTAETIASYPYLACLGVIYTVIAIPLTFGIKWGLGKLNPVAD